MFNKERIKGLVTGALIGAIAAGTIGAFAYAENALPPLFVLPLCCVTLTSATSPFN